jgi:predicted O-methyltransferase YrrM
MSQEERPTFFSPEELTQIREHCQTSGAKDVLEIGTYCGASTQALLQGCTGQVFSVDPLVHPETKLHHQQNWIRRLGKEFPERLVFIPATSQELIWERPVSIFMLDGDHRPSSVIRDFRMFCPHVIDRGSVIIDDMHDAGVSDMWNYYISLNRANHWEHLCGTKLQIWRKHKS